MNRNSIRLLYSFLLSIFITLLFSAKLLNNISSTSFFSYFDEILMLLIILVLMYSFIILKINKYILTLLLIFIYMIGISIYSHNSNIQNIILQSLIHLKFFIFYYLLDNYITKKELKMIFNYLFLFTIIGLIINLILQTSFNTFMLQEIDYRSGLLRLIGFQLSPNLLGLTLGLYYLYFILNKKIKISRMLTFTFLFFILIFLTGGRAALTSIVIGIYFYFISQNKKYKFYFLPILVLIFLSISFLIFYTDIGNRTINNINMIMDAENSSYIRGIMIFFGFQLASTYFPFGTGAATFGSILSTGSPIYDKLGLSSRSFFINMDGIYDSNFATILGEFGIIGIFLFIYLLYLIYKDCYTEDNVRYLQGLFIILIIILLTNPIFMNGYHSILFSMFFILIKKEKNENINNK